MMRTLLVIFVCSLSSAYAQIKGYAVQVAANYPVIPSQTTSSSIQTTPIDASSGYTSYWLNIGAIKESYEGRPGFDISGKFSYGVSKHFFVTSGLTVNYYRYKRSIKIEDLNTEENVILVPGGTSGTGGTPVIIGAPLGVIGGGSRLVGPNGKLIDNPDLTFNPDDRNGETTTLYLQLPVMAGTTFFNDRLVVQTGLTTSWIVRGTEYKSLFSYSGTYVYETKKETTTEEFNSVMIGLSLQTTYRITKSIGIEVSAQKSLSKIYDNESTGKGKLNTVSLGVSYNFFK
ncbi:MAG: outer membrane beta-barrel protein [Bacteroidota bacterium]